MDFKLGEFFCGPGGIALGAKKCETIKDKKGNTYSITPFWASDFDFDTCKTYALNIHNSKNSDCVIHDDVRNLNIKSLQSCDVFAFGFPCNDFSLVGENKGLNGKFGPLYKHGIEYLKTHQPKIFIAENVTGLISSNKGKAFEIILNSMKNAGYSITPHLYKFEDYGVPQTRHRIIIVGIRNDLNIDFKIPAPSHLNNHNTARDAICIPKISSEADNHAFTIQTRQVIERLKHIAPGDNAWSKSIPDDLRLNVKGAKLSNIYKRLHPNKPAYTVTGSGGGGTHMYHWEENRALTNRERARLQTFPDNFVFIGTKDGIRKQIGMAVPPDGMKVIFKAILNSYAKNKYSNIPSNIQIQEALDSSETPATL